MRVGLATPKSLAVALALVMASAGAAQAGRRLSMSCQKNLGDGRLLVTNGDALPEGARFKVLRFKATRREDIWSYGPCVIELRR